jgi:hypothetical protein
MKIYNFNISFAATNKSLTVILRFLSSEDCLLQNRVGLLLEMEKTTCKNLHVCVLGYKTALSDLLLPNISEDPSFVP